jgi:hypothetical protein
MLKFQYSSTVIKKKNRRPSQYDKHGLFRVYPIKLIIHVQFNYLLINFLFYLIVYGIF